MIVPTLRKWVKEVLHRSHSGRCPHRARTFHFEVASLPLVQVSVLLATRRRAALLQQTLAAMARMSTADLAWELIVVDNQGEAATRKVCESFSGQLPLRYLVCPMPGQNTARNHGLKEVRGELVVLSDDDMLPDEGWLRELFRGAQRWPEHVLFGGRALPEWPGQAPDFEINEDIGHWTYGICNPDLPEGPNLRFLPISTNMAIRRRVFESGLTFDESIGPRGRDYAMGSETEFNLRLRRLGFAAVFLPRALVHNVVQSHQLDREWVLGRAFRQGRGETRFQVPVSWYEIARLTKCAVWARAKYDWERLWHGQADFFPRRISCALTRGRLYEAWRLKLGLR